MPVPSPRSAILLCALLAAGCVSSQRVAIESAPSGADVYLDGVLIGQTPARVGVSRDRAHKVVLKREGYRSERVILKQHEASDRIDFVTPADVRVRLVPEAATLDRDLDIEVERAKP